MILPVIVFKIDGKNNNSKELRVRRQKIIDALTWLTSTDKNGRPNNIVYKDVIIDHSRFLQLPEDDFLNLSMTVDFENEMMEDEEILPDRGPNIDQDELLYDKNTEMGSFVPTKVKT